MNRYLVLASVGLCSLSFACGSADDGAAPNDSSAAGTTGTGGTAASGGALGVAGSAGQSGAAGPGTGGSGPVEAGGSSQGGETAGGAPGGAGSGGDGSVPNGGAGQGGAGQGGAGHVGMGGAPGTGLDPNQPPGKNFDLSHFTLQLPVANGPDNVQQISNLSTYTSQYFFTGKDGAMVFWCPVTGAHTKNTHYPRTELRELAPGGDWAISGTHSLTATLRVTKTPPSKGTIIGQIHGNATDGTAEVLKLEWMTTNAVVASVEANDDPATQVDKIIGNYTLGDEITYVIQLENSTLTVTVTDANGSKSITSPYTAASWKNDKYYFKLGDYVQLNTGPSTDGGEVSFYAFAIKHG